MKQGEHTGIRPSHYPLETESIMRNLAGRLLILHTADFRDLQIIQACFVVILRLPLGLGLDSSCSSGMSSVPEPAARGSRRLYLRSMGLKKAVSAGNAINGNDEALGGLSGCGAFRREHELTVAELLGVELM